MFKAICLSTITTLLLCLVACSSGRSRLGVDDQALSSGNQVTRPIGDMTDSAYSRQVSTILPKWLSQGKDNERTNLAGDHTLGQSSSAVLWCGTSSANQTIGSPVVDADDNSYLQCANGDILKFEYDGSSSLYFCAPSPGNSEEHIYGLASPCITPNNDLFSLYSVIAEDGEEVDGQIHIVKNGSEFATVRGDVCYVAPMYMETEVRDNIPSERIHPYSLELVVIVASFIDRSEGAVAYGVDPSSGYVLWENHLPEANEYLAPCIVISQPVATPFLDDTSVAIEPVNAGLGVPEEYEYDCITIMLSQSTNHPVSSLSFSNSLISLAPDTGAELVRSDDTYGTVDLGSFNGIVFPGTTPFITADAEIDATLTLGDNHLSVFTCVDKDALGSSIEDTWIFVPVREGLYVLKRASTLLRQALSAPRML
jgi:hypothetical protein